MTPCGEQITNRSVYCLLSLPYLLPPAMRGNGNVFRPGDSIAIEIRGGEASLRPVCIQKSTPPCQSETRGYQCRANRLRENYVGTPRTSLVRTSGPSLVCLVCLVCLVSLVHLVDLVYPVGLVQPNNRDRPDRPNRLNEQDRLADFFSILQRPISSVEEGATAPLPRWPAQHHSCREGLPS
jgi:hypothetical protein